MRGEATVYTLRFTRRLGPISLTGWESISYFLITWKEANWPKESIPVPNAFPFPH